MSILKEQPKPLKAEVFYDTAILVLIYNKEFNESLTLSSLKASRVQFENAKLVLWNNGPKNLDSYNTSSLSDIGYNVEIRETLDNESLAKIYNFFIEENNADKYVFLDDDSTLNSKYVDDVNNSLPSEVAMPIIYSGGNIKNPKINSRTFEHGQHINEDDKIFTTGSGIVIGKKVILEVMNSFNTVFDDRYYFYGVDTTFCHRLYLCSLVGSVRIISGFEHSLSRFEVESDSVKHFRRIERSCDRGMTLRHYTPPFTALYVLVRSVLYTLKCIVTRKKSSMSLLMLFKSFYTGRHYRDSKTVRK